MTRILKKICKSIVDILTAIIFLFLIIIIVAKVQMVFTGNSYFNFFGYSVFKVVTGSMEPTIKQNDVIVTKKTFDYKVNDIITYENKGDYITHRILNIDGDNYITKGDANNTSDNAITKDMIIGKVINVYHNLAVWHKIFTTPTILISIFITLMLFDFAFAYKGKPKNEKIVKKIPLEKEEDKTKEPTITPIKVSNFNDKEHQRALELTQNLDLDLLKRIQDEMIKENKGSKMTDEELNEFSQKIKSVSKDDDDLPKLKKKESKLLEYTMRLDLTELQKEINSKISRR